VIFLRIKGKRHKTLEDRRITDDLYGIDVLTPRRGYTERDIELFALSTDFSSLPLPEGIALDSVVQIIRALPDRAGLIITQG